MPVKMFGGYDDFDDSLLPTSLASAKKPLITEQNLLRNSITFKKRAVQPIIYSIKGEDTIKFLRNNTDQQRLALKKPTSSAREGFNNRE